MTDDTRTIEQPTRAFDSVMLCPPSGRGMLGKLCVGWSLDGHPLAVWTSEAIPPRQLTFRPRNFQDKAKLGGRILLHDGRYMLFGKKKLAREFLSEMDSPSLPFRPPSTIPPQRDWPPPSLPPADEHQEPNATPERSDEHEEPNDAVEEDYSELLVSFWSGVDATLDAAARHPDQLETLRPLMDEWIEESGDAWARIILRAIGERQSFYGYLEDSPQVPVIDFLTADQILADPLVTAHLQAMHWDGANRPLVASDDDPAARRVWAECWTAGYAALEERLTLIAQVRNFEIRVAGTRESL